MTHQTSNRNRFEKFESILGRIFFSLIIFFVLFAIADKISLKFLPDKTPFDTQFGESRVRKPYVTFSGPSNANGFNRLGYRGPEPIMPKPPGEYRIIIEGGSLLLWSTPTLPELIELNFRQHGMHHVKVYNFGVVSGVSTQSLVRLLLEITELRPNLIIIINGANDIISPLMSDPRPGYPYNFLLLENNPLFHNAITEYPKWDLFLYGSNILRHILRPYFEDRFGSIEDLREEAGFGSKEWQNQIATIYLKNTMKAEIVARAFGAKMAVFFQPMIYFKDHWSPKEQKMSKYLNKRKDYVLAIHQRILLGAQGFDKGVNFSDLSGFFKNDPDTAFFDDVHLVDGKYEILAQEIYRSLVSNDNIFQAMNKK